MGTPIACLGAWRDTALRDDEERHTEPAAPKSDVLGAVSRAGVWGLTVGMM
jgi:hypothetical protein